ELPGHAAGGFAARAVPHVHVIDHVVLVAGLGAAGDLQAAVQVIVQVDVLELDVTEAAAGLVDRDADALAAVVAEVHVANEQAGEILVGVVNVRVEAGGEVSRHAAADEVEVGDRDPGGLREIDALLVA